MGSLSWVREHRVGAMRLVETAYSPGAAQGDHRHDEASVTMVLTGGVAEQVAGRERFLGPGAVLVKPGATTHADHFDERPTRLLTIHVARPRARRAMRELAARYSIVRDPAVTTLFLDLYAMSRDGARRERSAATADRLIARLVAVRCEHNGRFMELAAEFEREPERTARDAAAERGVHPVYLARTFRAGTGRAPAEYTRRVRLERAAAAALAGASLVSVAMEAGFADQAHFTRCFRAEFGVSPGRFRALVRDA